MSMLMEMSVHMPQVTVIVPVYNAEPYLRCCLDGLRAQTLKDFDVIVVDDGSTDNSGEICDEYASKDWRLVVLHKENGGVSSARNLALDRARGKYVMFIDSDDWMEPNGLAIAVDAISHRQADTICMGFVENNDIPDKEPYHDVIDGKAQVKRWICEMTAERAAVSKHGVNPYTPWAKLYRRDIIEGHHLRFDNELKVAQDFWFNLCYYIYCNRIVIDNSTIYHYVTSKGSLVRHYSDVRLRDGLVFMKRIEDYLHNAMDDDEAFRKAVRFQLLTTLNIALNSYFVHRANKDGFFQKRRKLCSYLKEPVIRRWTAELTWKDGRNRQLLRDVVLLKCQLYWLRLLTDPMKRSLRRILTILKGRD